MPTPNKRKLAVEEWRPGQVKDMRPMIRLKGQWLTKAGFAPGSKVQVEAIRPGVIELRLETSDTLKPETKAAYQATLAQFDALPEAIAPDWHRMDRREPGCRRKGCL